MSPGLHVVECQKFSSIDNLKVKDLPFCSVLQVAKCIQLIIESVKASIVVKLDMEKIKSSRLFINAHIVKEKILKSLRMQKNNKLVSNLLLNKYVPYIVNCWCLMHSYLQIVIVVNDSKLVVSVETQNKNDAHFVLHWVKNKLPMVVIKVRPCIYFS